MYKMELKTSEKVLLINMSGFMTRTESLGCVKELENKIKEVNPTQYNIVVDADGLKTSSPELVGHMEKALDMISNTPFKMRFSILPKDIIATSQVKRVGRVDDKFKDTIFVGSYEEALDLIG